MSEQQRQDVLVLGAGIVGICCGLSLLEKGLRVTLVDRAQPAEGASRGNAGVISPWSNVPQCIPGIWKKIPGWLMQSDGPVAIDRRQLRTMVPWSVDFLRNSGMQDAVKTSDAFFALNEPTIDLYRHHLRGTGAEDVLRESNFIHVFRRKEQANLDGVAWTLRARHNTPVEVLSAETLREMEPDLSPDYEAAIMIMGQARAALPGRLGKALAAKFEQMGGRIRQCGVHEIAPLEGSGWRLKSDDGDIETNKLVIAAGAWSVKLLAPFGIRLPLAAERGYHMTFSNPGVSLNNSVMETNRLFVCSSMENGVRSAGTSEFSGLDNAPTYSRAEVLRTLTRALLPNINTTETSEWMGVRPSLPDNLPCIGSVPKLPGLYAAFGHSHWGMSMAPRTGEVIADLVSGAGPTIDLTPYRVERFQ